MKPDSNELLEKMNRSRQSTFSILDWVLDESDTRRIPKAGFRPILWHLAHVGAFEEFWLLIRNKGQTAINPRYQVIFDPIRTPREESANLPSRGEMEGYLASVRSCVEELYENAKDAEQLFLLNLVLEHEYQHQETLSYLLQMLPPESKRGHATAAPMAPAGGHSLPESILVEGGSFEHGSSEDFVYDNEKPRHLVTIGDFLIDRVPVTNGQFLEFINAGGYQDSRLWSEPGWEWKEANAVAGPEYWQRGSTGWETIEMFDRYALRPDYPVTGVSWHEAQAYARFAGKRLPNEDEWQKAAGWDDVSTRMRRFAWGDEQPHDLLANFNGQHAGTSAVGAYPRGASATGCLDMTGNIWEWTSTTFGPFPGFKAYPYPEYSELWFDGDHRILKGGSWMTRPPLLRLSFRNFFRPGFRFAFAGFRCARDA
jgi:iron(II)-dependent oxidoreductase